MRERIAARGNRGLRCAVLLGAAACSATAKAPTSTGGHEGAGGAGRVAEPAQREDARQFWAAWGDGRAEVSGYDLRKSRYGRDRAGHAVLIFVTEDFDERARVKAERPAAAAGGGSPVLKLNHVAKFQTGVYDYSLMTSVFARVAPSPAGAAWPLRKVSFSGQEWCGHVYHQIIPDPQGQGGRLRSTSHSYFEGEADQDQDLPLPPDGLSEDALPLVLRSYPGRPDLLAPGARREVPLLPALSRVRLRHQPLRWARATLSRSAAPAPFATPAGTFPAVAYSVTLRGDSAATSDSGAFYIEAAAPHRVLGWRWQSGEEALLRGSARLPYWQLNAPGGEAALAQLGLSPVYTPGPPPTSPPAPPAR